MLREEDKPQLNTILQTEALLYLWDFPKKRRIAPRTWVSLQGAQGEDPAEGGGPLSGPVGVKDQEMLLRKGPPFPVWGGCSPPPAQGEGGYYCLYIFFQTHIRFRFGQDGAGEPQRVASCKGFCSRKNKEPHPSGLKRNKTLY